MEVDEENTSIHLKESTTTNEHNNINDKELGKESKEEELSAVVPKLDDPNPSSAIAEGETAEVTVECMNSCENSVSDGDVREVINSGDVAAEEDGDTELPTSDKVEGGECQPVDNGSTVVEENVNNSCDVDDDQNDKDADMETVKVEEDDGEALNVSDVSLLPVAGREEVMNNDVVVDTEKENVEDDAKRIYNGKTPDLHGGIDAEVLKEEDAIGIKEKAVDVTGNDEEEKSLDTELETDEEKVPEAEEMETELLDSSTKSTAGKRKRGRKNSKTTTKPMVARTQMIEEDVCFICFDGGDLVLCDLRNCPKAYHPSCVNRDEAFFQTKGKWNCGWHLCSICVKKAEYMCYTCTYSLCKACIKTNVIFCVREKEKKGLCEACMKTIMLIEKNSQENQDNVDFDDKNSWEYLFKDYWLETKEKLNISLSELVEAKNTWKGSEPSVKQEPPLTHSDVKEENGSGSENPSENLLETRKNSKGKSKKRKSTSVSSEGTKNTEWASKELLEFVMHMANGNKSIKSQFDVQALLLEYIKKNNLRDSRRKSQIICDTRLERLFGKPRVGHFEMLKLLESHFLIKEDSQIDDTNNHGSMVDTEGDDEEGNGTVGRSGKDKKRKMRKKGEREPQPNREDYAAIDTHNISLIYLRRKLMEDLLGDTETFHSKVVGTFVRIRITGANLKQDTYRLVQVTGTTKVAQYAVGKKMTDLMLEILNLNKPESISIDTISNQDFNEDECKRLRQSIKLGLITRPKVGDILDKAMELQATRVNDWLETEILRLSHLRDRASDLGRKKELRECVEKLQVLKTPEERARKLEEIPIIHVDPNHDSDEDENKQDVDMYKSSVDSRFSRRREYPTKESWSGAGTSTSSYGFTRSLSNNNFSSKVDDATTTRFETQNERIWDQGKKDTIVQPPQPTILKKPTSVNNETNSAKVNETEKMWHYKDPSGKIQGPFSMAQLRKWSNNKYFPADLRIWGKSEKEEDGVLLTDALEGRFHTRAQTSVEIPKPLHDNLPSPTPNKSSVGTGLYGSGKEELQSPTPNSSQVGSFEQQSGHHLVASQMVQSGGGQSHCWGDGAAPQPSNVSGPGQQQVGYNQWANVPNFLSQSAAAAAVNVQQPPPQAHVSWPANPNMGMVPGNQVMNWQSPQPWAGGWAPQQPPANRGWVPSGIGASGELGVNQGSSSWAPQNRGGGYSGQKRNNDDNNRGGASGYRRQWDNRHRDTSNH